MRFGTSGTKDVGYNHAAMHLARGRPSSKEVPKMSKVLDALAALATIGTFFIAFFDSYEFHIKFRRRSRDADSGRELRRKRK